MAETGSNPNGRPAVKNGRSAKGVAAPEAGVDAHPEAAIDLNTATVNELRRLRGVGPALAERIVQYRATAGGFGTPEDLLRVPGISQAVFDANRHGLVVRAPGTANSMEQKPPAPPQPETDQAALPEAVDALAPTTGEALSATEGAVPQAVDSQAVEAREAATTEGQPIAINAEDSGQSRVPTAPTGAAGGVLAGNIEYLPEAMRVEPAAGDASESRVQPAPTGAAGDVLAGTIEYLPSAGEVPRAAETAGSRVGLGSAKMEPASTPGLQPDKPAMAPSVFAPPIPAAAPPQAAPVAAPQPARRDWTGLMAMTVLGAVLGAVLALLAMAGLNGGALMLNERAEVVALRADLDAAETRADALETEATALRARMEALEGLSNRVVEVESGLAAADAALDTLEDETAALDERTTAVEGEVAVVRSAVDRFSEFLVGLRTLLDAALPGDGPSATATPAASATPANPTRTPAATRTPATTATP